jgi:hypothetical protein
MSEWQLARRRKIMAFRFGRRLWITAEGMKPSPCYEVEVQQALIKIFPPQYNLLWRQTPGVMCPQVLTPYRVSGSFPAMGSQDYVVVHHAGGEDKVKVHDIPLAGLSERGGAELAESEDAAGGGGALYTGYSPTSFDEAYFDAVSKIPIHPDELFHVRVVEQGGTHGSIVGITELFVTVRKLGPSSARDGSGEGGEALSSGGGGATGPAGGDPCDHVIEYRAEQNLHDVIIHAEGVNPTTGWKQWFVMSPLDIWPPQFEVLHEAPEIGGDAFTPFYIHTSFPARERVEEVTVHDARGEHRVKVEWVPD